MKTNSAYIALAQEFKLLKDEPLKRYTSFKVGGPADVLFVPEDKNELLSSINQASVLNVPITLIGGGTNV